MSNFIKEWQRKSRAKDMERRRNAAYHHGTTVKNVKNWQLLLSGDKPIPKPKPTNPHTRVSRKATQAYSRNKTRKW